jgi:hypothetical protein
LEIIANSTAGLPMDDTVKWTNLSQEEIAKRLEEKNHKISVPVVKQLLRSTI